MANRRMFSKRLINSDRFIEMPLTTRGLYFHLCLEADDEGFIDNSSTIMRIVGASKDDFSLLIAKQFLFEVDSTIYVVTNWFEHNQIRKDRKTKSKYSDLKNRANQLTHGAYLTNKK